MNSWKLSDSGASATASETALRPAPRQILVELLRDAVVVTPFSSSPDETLLGLDPTMPSVEDPGDANLVDMANP
jgi:hypothetical protein